MYGLQKGRRTSPAFLLLPLLTAARSPPNRDRRVWSGRSRFHSCSNALLRLGNPPDECGERRNRFVAAAARNDDPDRLLTHTIVSASVALPCRRHGYLLLIVESPRNGRGLDASISPCVPAPVAFASHCVTTLYEKPTDGRDRRSVLNDTPLRPLTVSIGYATFFHARNVSFPLTPPSVEMRQPS